MNYTRKTAKSRDIGGPAQPLLTVEKLKKYFPIRSGLFSRVQAEVKAVDDISLSIKKGEILGIVGESGCGKSTTARLLMQLIKPDQGSVIFDGQEVGSPNGISISELRRNMQMVFQDSFSSLNPRMSIRDSIAFSPQAHGVDKKQAAEKANMLLEAVGLDPALFGSRYPHQMSGGQRQRANIARALALDPRLLILDEAVSALDKSVEAQVLTLLLKLRERLNLTYLFISHDLNVVHFISDRVLVMYLGTVVELADTDTLYSRPRHPYTQALLASRPSLDHRQRGRQPQLTGDPPNPIDLPKGCKFCPRCPYTESICKASEPKLTKTGSGSFVACHMADTSSSHSKSGYISYEVTQ